MRIIRGGEDFPESPVTDEGFDDSEADQIVLGEIFEFARNILPSRPTILPEVGETDNHISCGDLMSTLLLSQTRSQGCLEISLRVDYNDTLGRGKDRALIAYEVFTIQNLLGHLVTRYERNEYEVQSIKTKLGKEVTVLATDYDDVAYICKTTEYIGAISEGRVDTMRFFLHELREAYPAVKKVTRHDNEPALGTKDTIATSHSGPEDESGTTTAG